jgi:hypothetical protein
MSKNTQTPQRIKDRCSAGLEAAHHKNSERTVKMTIPSSHRLD